MSAVGLRFLTASSNDATCSWSCAKSNLWCARFLRDFTTKPLTSEKRRKVNLIQIDATQITTNLEKKNKKKKKKKVGFRSNSNHSVRPRTPSRRTSIVLWPQPVARPPVPVRSRSCAQCQCRLHPHHRRGTCDPSEGSW